SGSATTWARSMASWPMVRAMMSRMALSVTKPSRTSRRPIGILLWRCSASAMESWSVVISPCWTSSSPNRSFLRCSAIGKAGKTSSGRLFYLRGEVADALLGLRDVEVGAAFGGRQLQGAPVVAEREILLADVLQADREVVGVIGVGRVEVVGLEIGLLRRRPIRPVGVEVAQDEVQVGRGLQRNQV